MSFKELPSIFLPFSIFIVATYYTILPFIQNINALLITRFNFDIVDAGLVSAYPGVITAFLAPFGGYISDKYSNRGH